MDRVSVLIARIMTSSKNGHVPSHHRKRPLIYCARCRRQPIGSLLGFRRTGIHSICVCSTVVPSPEAQYRQLVTRQSPESLPFPGTGAARNIAAESPKDLLRFLAAYTTKMPERWAKALFSARDRWKKSGPYTFTMAIASGVGAG